MSLKQLLDEIPAWFLRFPAGQKILEEDRQHTEEERAELGARLAAVRAERLKALPPLAKARDVAAGAVKTADKRLREAREAYRKVWSQVSGSQTSFDQRESSLQGDLRRSCPAALDDFVAEIKGLLDSTRRKGSEFYGETKFDMLRGADQTTYTGNSEAVKRRCAYLVDALGQAESLRGEYLPPEALTARLQEIRAGVPECRLVWNDTTPANRRDAADARRARESRPQMPSPPLKVLALREPEVGQPAAG
jgi:hypothetical protein